MFEKSVKEITLLKYLDNKVQYSKDNVNWEICDFF